MLLLASASPRRAELLVQVGVEFKVVQSFAEEKKVGKAEELVLENAILKARSALKEGEFPILAADTVVFLEEQIFGKPQDSGRNAKSACGQDACSGNGNRPFKGNRTLYGCCLYKS